MTICIKAAYIGNAAEAFIEQRLKKGINVIFSEDNNVGKTIVMQGIMYTLGAMPQFPKGFNHRDFLFAVDVVIDKQEYSILRSRNTFLVQNESQIIPFESQHDFQEWWNREIEELPTIVKDGRNVCVGMELYSQMAFVPQDKRASSSVASGRFNKNDFIEMIYALANLEARTLGSSEIACLKRRKEELQSKRRQLLKQAKTLKTQGSAIATLSPTADRAEKDRLLEHLNQLKNEIASLRKERNRAFGRMKKNEIALEELNSLNRELIAGSVICLECGSSRIGYQEPGAEYVFDITTNDVRSQILTSVRSRIDDYASAIKELDSRIRDA